MPPSTLETRVGRCSTWRDKSWGKIQPETPAIASTTGTDSEGGFSMPVVAVRQVVPKLVENSESVYPYMGVSFDNEMMLGERLALGGDCLARVEVLSIEKLGKDEE